jgi:hypothetical protein
MTERDFGQLCWELYKNKTKHRGYQLYKDKEELKNCQYIIREDGLEISQYWARQTFFGVQEARIGLAAICELAKGYLVRVSFNETFTWKKSQIEGKPNRCRNGWQIFILPAKELFDGNCEVLDVWLPPYADDRFEYTLELNFTNWYYSLKWVDGVYTFTGHCYCEEGVEAFKNVFPEFPAKVQGNKDDGWEIVVQIYKKGKS